MQMKFRNLTLRYKVTVFYGTYWTDKFYVKIKLPKYLVPYFTLLENCLK